jgi:plastocyanin
MTVACGDDDGGSGPVDAATTADAAAADAAAADAAAADAAVDARVPDADLSDADPLAPDARPDAAVDATVDGPPTPPPPPVVEVDCASVTPTATVVINGSGNGYTITPSATIAVGQAALFRMPSRHNAVSGSPGQGDGKFTANFDATTCFRFDLAGTYPFFCGPHQFTGQLVVAGN